MVPAAVMSMGKKLRERGRRHEHGLVAGGGGLRREDVHHLRDRRARDHVDRDGRDLARGQGADEVVLDEREEQRDEGAALLQAAHLVEAGRPGSGRRRRHRRGARRATCRSRAPAVRYSSSLANAAPPAPASTEASIFFAASRLIDSGTMETRRSPATPSFRTAILMLGGAFKTLPPCGSRRQRTWNDIARKELQQQSRKFCGLGPVHHVPGAPGSRRVEALRTRLRGPPRPGGASRGGRRRRRGLDR